MYTAEEIRNITFAKSLGGYKTNEVDDFIDSCAETVEALTQTNQELKKKMELLANKVVEYRNDEDSIRTALLSAQRLGDTVLREANQKAELVIEDAKIKAEKIEETTQKQMLEQIDELERLKKAVSDFKTQILASYREQLLLIDALPECKEEAVEETAEAVEEPAAEMTETEDPLPATAGEKEEIAPLAEKMTETVETQEPEQTEDAESAMPVLTVDSEQNEETETETTRFSNLKFGVDYSLADDMDDADAQLFGRKRRR